MIECGDLVVRFTVVGRPRSAGSKTSFVPKKKDGSMVTRPDGSPMVVTKDSAGVPGEQWRTAVAESAVKAMLGADGWAGADAIAEAAANLEPIEGPLVAEVVFYFQRPKSHYRSGRNAHLLKDGAPAWPATKPDVGKLSRAVQDALTGCLYRDDAQIVRNVEEKRFGTPERAEITIYVARAA